MGTVSTNEMRSGTKVLVDGEPYSIVDNEYRKPGKGQATNTVRIRSLKSGRVIDRTLKSGDTWEVADIEEVEMQYLYNDGEFWHFMNPASYEQIQTGKVPVGDSAQWLKEQDTVRILFWNGSPMSVTPPNTVNLKVVQTDPGMRGDTVTGGSKPAKLESGAMVKVPLFINEGELIKVDTRTGEYLSRVKE